MLIDHDIDMVYVDESDQLFFILSRRAYFQQAVHSRIRRHAMLLRINGIATIASYPVKPVDYLAGNSFDSTEKGRDSISAEKKNVHDIDIRR